MKNDLTPYELLYLFLQQKDFPLQYNGYKIKYFDKKKCSECPYRDGKFTLDTAELSSYYNSTDENIDIPDLYVPIEIKECDNCYNQCDIEYIGTIEDKVKTIMSWITKQKEKAENNTIQIGLW